MSVVAPETEARLALIDILNVEFAPLAAEDDKLHGSVGDDGARIGVYPEYWTPRPGNMTVGEATLVVQYYDQWDKVVDNNQSVSPATIEMLAERFRRALQRGIQRPGTGTLWYFDLQRVEYLDDPTGNKSRFHATVVARGNNTALVETAG